jgi:hypothetical protein
MSKLTKSPIMVTMVRLAASCVRKDPMSRTLGCRCLIRPLVWIDVNNASDSSSRESVENCVLEVPRSQIVVRSIRRSPF